MRLYERILMLAPWGCSLGLPSKYSLQRRLGAVRHAAVAGRCPPPSRGAARRLPAAAAARRCLRPTPAARRQQFGWNDATTRSAGRSPPARRRA